MDWEPRHFCKDATANALLNIAAEINGMADATRKLLYGLKYGEREGMSIAEAIEEGLESAASIIAAAIPDPRIDGA